MGRRDHPLLALGVLYIGTALNEPSVAHELRRAVGVGAAGGLHIRTAPNITLLEAGPIGDSLTSGLDTEPDAGREYERETGWTSEEGWGSPMVIMDGVSFMEGVIGMIDDDYPFQCTCKSSQHYLTKMFGKDIPRGVSIPKSVRATLEFWLDRSNGGTSAFAGDQTEMAQFQLMIAQAENELWGAASGFVQEFSRVPPTSFLELGSHMMASHRATVALLTKLFARQDPRNAGDTWNNADADGNPWYVDAASLAKKYNNYNYEYRDGYCEKDTRKPCFPIPGATTGVGILVLLLVQLA